LKDGENLSLSSKPFLIYFLSTSSLIQRGDAKVKKTRTVSCPGQVADTWMSGTPHRECGFSGLK
jgi:hypothetical protein